MRVNLGNAKVFAFRDLLIFNNKSNFFNIKKTEPGSVFHSKR